MRRIKDVNIEVWAGAPGKARAGGPNAPQKREGDGPKTIVTARIETEKAFADVDMPQVAKDKILWVQPVLTDEKGRKLWGNAEPVTPNGLPPLDRPETTLQPRLMSHPERTVTVKEKLVFRVMGGINDREYASSHIEAKVLEKATRFALGGGQVQWFVGEASRDENVDGKQARRTRRASPRGFAGFKFSSSSTASARPTAASSVEDADDPSATRS